MTLSPRKWRLLGIAAAILLLVGAWFAVISPTLQKAEALETETAGQLAASEQLRSRISLLKKQSEELPEQEAILAEIGQQMPPTAALPSLIRNLTTVASEANVVVASVTPGRPTPVQQPVAPPPPPTETDSEEGEGESDAEADVASDGADADAAAAAAAAVPTGPEVEAVSLSITACGTYAQIRNYLRELESMKRVMTVSNVSIAPGKCAEGSAEDDLTAAISGNVFVLPNPDPVSADVTSDSTEATKGDDDE
jgi:Tfp pilus assembly protein PilO